MPATKPTYWDYIRVEDLLSLQGGLERDESRTSNDEVLFIVVHQVYELWFKLVLRELTSARDLFRKNPVPDAELGPAVRSLRRVTTIWQLAVRHFAVVETLTTRDYLSFRDRLIPASGFQSAQLREIEILLGLPSEDRVPLGSPGSWMESLRAPDGQASPALRRVEARLADGPSFREVLFEWLHRTPIDGSGPDRPGDEEHVARFLDRFLAAHRKDARDRLELSRAEGGGAEASALLERRYEKEMADTEAFLRAEDEPTAGPEVARRRRRIRAALVFIESYRELPRLAWPREVIEAVIELEQAMIVFRQRHARMVERIIGRRTGTGGSAGVDYLDATSRYRVFGDLWAVRSLLLRAKSLPELEHAGEYAFRVED